MRDYARKPELQDEESHVEWMKKVPYRALQWEHPTKESEFKKPYLEDDHVKMEAFPQWPFPWTPTWPHPNFPDPVPDDVNSPWYPGGPGKEKGELDTECPGGIWCMPGNPTTIIAGDNEVLAAGACPEPNTVTAVINKPLTEYPERFNVVGQPLDLGNGLWAVGVHADADACGMCVVEFIDGITGYSAYCYLRCTTGTWISCGTTSQSGCCNNGCTSGYWEVDAGHKWYYECGNRSGYGFDGCTKTCADGETSTMSKDDVCETGWKICGCTLYYWACA